MDGRLGWSPGHLRAPWRNRQLVVCIRVQNGNSLLLQRPEVVIGVQKDGFKSHGRSDKLVKVALPSVGEEWEKMASVLDKHRLAPLLHCDWRVHFNIGSRGSSPESHFESRDGLQVILGR